MDTENRRDNLEQFECVIKPKPGDPEPKLAEFKSTGKIEVTAKFDALTVKKGKAIITITDDPDPDSSDVNVKVEFDPPHQDDPNSFSFAHFIAFSATNFIEQLTKQMGGTSNELGTPDGNEPDRPETGH